MGNLVTITVDGETIETPEGGNVLEAALQAGICIPNLCYLPDGKPTGACRVCLVEVESHGRMKMTASCTLEAKEGLVVHAHSANVLRARRNIVELLLAEAPESPVLQKLAERVEVSEVRYPSHDRDCILCGRCVSACAFIAKSGTKGIIGRGTQRHVGLPFYKQEYCQRCRECDERCPLGIQPSARRGEACGVCGSELSKNDENPDICQDCVLG
jgi:NADH dehydrogenase/NADH:ubiquinone oxidoreductase subunit G